MKQILGLIVLLSLFIPNLDAQDGFDNEELKGVIYNKEFTLDFRFHTNGLFALAVNKAKIRTYYRTQFYQLELGTLKHPKETRNNDLGISYQGFSSSSYSFGKQNSFYLLRAGYGEKRYFSEKQEERGVAVGLSYMVGASLGMLKPYYLDVRFNDGDGNYSIQRVRYSEEIEDSFLDVENILGASGFKFGWTEPSFIPGVNAKVGVHLDWGAFDEFVKGLEFGFMIDGYYKKVPIMITEKNKFLFVNVYLALQIGKRS